MRSFLLFMSAVLAVTAARAQSNETPSELTFREAVEIAVKNNITIKRQKNEQYVNQVQKNSSIANFAPQLSAFGQAWRVQGNQFIEQEARVVNDAQTSNVFGTLDASILLFNGFNNVNSLKQANSQFEAQEYLVERTQQLVITDVSNQYLTCLLDQELLKIEQENVAFQKSQLDQIAAQTEEGSRPEVDKYNQESQLKLAEVNLLRAEIRLRNDKAILARTLQLDPTVVFDIVEPSWDVNTVQQNDYQLETLYSSAESSRADLLRFEKLEDATKRGMKIARASSIPSLRGYGSINSRYSDASVPSFTDQIDDNQRREYGLRLNIPIFNGLQNRSTFARAKVNHENAKLDLQDTENLVKTDVLQAYQNLLDAIRNYQANKVSVEAAEISFKLEEESFNLNVSDLVQFTQATRDYNVARANFAQARYTLLFQDLLVKLAVGNLSMSDLP